MLQTNIVNFVIIILQCLNYN